MRITSKGQVTIPLEVRERFGFLPDTEVQFEIKGNQVILRKMTSENHYISHRKRELIRKMAGKGSVKMSTDEIMRLTRSS